MFGVKRDLFWLVMLAQTFNAITDALVLQLPPKLAAIWFPETEIATATSIGVNANLLGVAFGFFIPSLFIKGVYFSDEDIGSLFLMFLI